MFKLIRTTVYKKKFQKLNAFKQRRIRHFERGLKRKPFSGKPLGVRFIREKKFNGKLPIFVVYKQEEAILLGTITDKKYQQQVIDHIRASLPRYKRRIRELLNLN